MSLMFFQSVPHEVFYPRRASRVSCHCGRPDVYGPYRVPSVYSFRRPQPRPHYQVPLFAHILSDLLKERQAEEDKSHKKEEKGSTPSGQKEVVKPEQFETKVNVKGFHPSEISVKIKDDRYVEVLARHEEKSEDRHTYREFKKFVQLPEGVDPQQVTPVLSTDGVLTVKGPMSLTLTKESINQDTEVEMKPETADIRGDTKEECEGQANVSLEPTVSESEEVIHMVEDEANDEHKVDHSAKDEDKSAMGSIQMDEAEEPEVTRSSTPCSEAQKDEDIMETNQEEGVQDNSKQSREGSEIKSEDTSECKELEGEKLQSKTVKIDIIHE